MATLREASREMEAIEFEKSLSWSLGVGVEDDFNRRQSGCTCRRLSHAKEAAHDAVEARLRSITA